MTGLKPCPATVTCWLIISRYSFHCSSGRSDEVWVNNLAGAICSVSSPKWLPRSVVVRSHQMLAEMSGNSFSVPHHTLNYLGLRQSFSLFLSLKKKKKEKKDVLLFFSFSSGLSCHDNKVECHAGFHLCCLTSYGVPSSAQTRGTRLPYGCLISHSLWD